jgi:hypothetical protein
MNPDNFVQSTALGFYYKWLHTRGGGADPSYTIICLSSAQLRVCIQLLMQEREYSISSIDKWLTPLSVARFKDIFGDIGYSKDNFLTQYPTGVGIRWERSAKGANNAFKIYLAPCEHLQPDSDTHQYKKFYEVFTSNFPLFEQLTRETEEKRSTEPSTSGEKQGNSVSIESNSYLITQNKLNYNVIQGTTNGGTLRKWGITGTSCTA